ncbi:MAG: hemolysin activation protein [Alloprevotella sp.]|nr:hemolysin activation protein [Alloprevotella sp.]
MNTATPLPPANIDLSVLILFFNRPDNLARVFAEVRRARPTRLFLYQDGPRGERDMEGIAGCRKVVEDIDWQCEVHRLYQEKNYGCDPSEFISQRWAFSLTDKCMVLEDDDIPAQSFFPFCKEMLDRYEHDERIGMIAGFNTDERTTDCGSDSYFFTTNFSIWGWASWRRVVEKWEGDYAFLDREATMQHFEAIAKERGLMKGLREAAEARRKSGREYYESIFHFHLLLNSQLAIVPVVNQITNIGVSSDSTHFAGSLETLPRAYRRIFTMERPEMHFPLQHPTDVIDHVAYRKRFYRVMGWNCPWVKLGRSFEELWINLRHGQFKNILRAATNRLRILVGGRNYG